MKEISDFFEFLCRKISISNCNDLYMAIDIFRDIIEFVRRNKRDLKINVPNSVLKEIEENLVNI